MHAAQAYVSGQQRYDDVAELCGGASGTVKLLVRRGYRSGPNFDLVCGYDLLKKEDRWHFFEYLAHCQPSVLIISTPCTGLKGFSALNRVVNHEGWLRSRRTSLALGKIAIEAARLQLEEGRHSVIEQPLNSELFQTEGWKKLERNYTIYQTAVDQCMAGKIGNRTLMPINKPIEFRSSRRQLVVGLQKFKCDGRHEHASLGERGVELTTRRKIRKDC